MNEVTRILNDPDDRSVDRLLPILYDELRHMASARMADEGPGQTLAATGLVHEAWLKLVGNDTRWESRSHFFAAAAEAMRRILIDRARKKNALKRGGKRRRADIDLDSIEGIGFDERLIRLDEALTRFTALDPTRAELVKLRYFAGCTIEEAAGLLGISTATADRYWVYARAWLQTELQEPDGSGNS